MKALHRLSNWVYSIEKFAAIILCGTMLFSLAAGVLYRYVLSSPLTWSDEIAIFSLVWLSFIGGSMSIKRKESAAVSILMDKMKGKLRTVLLGIGMLALLAFVAYIFYLSIGWLSSPNIRVQKSSSIGLPMIYAYLSIPVCFLFMVIHTLELVLDNFFGKQGGSAS
ncbi:TRAP transporter small permease [Sporosarcina sp. FSL W7-1349]|uniref:TRAP transporter small permease n=1 Tax=Bacillales TaxID=1385 RepID=UPI000581E2BF|nr:TRAP transporter small permease [Bacillus sp. OxB-1]BAQ09315.1 TRAP-type C4-dicarboxylate transport system, small permease component [Bacillus sp. OxB-1]